jgi:hypothetical protein
VFHVKVAAVLVTFVAWRLAGEIQLKGVKVKICPVAGLVVIVSVETVELAVGVVEILFTDIKLPLPVPAAVIPIEAPRESVVTAAAPCW